MAKKVYIGIGHGGSDPGAVANGFKEKNLTLDVGKACYKELSRCGVIAKMSRTADVYESVNAKVAESNAFGADLCVDIHINAGRGDGSECYYRRLSTASKKAATAIVNACKAEVGQNTRGVKVKLNSKGNADYFGIIRSTKAPVALLMECFFIDNKVDLAIGDTLAERQKLGVAIAHGILNYFGIAVKPVVVTTAKPASTSTAGEAVELKNEPLYAASTAKTRSGRISGTYYYWDSTTTNGRRRVTNRAARAGVSGQVTGWIKA